MGIVLRLVAALAALWLLGLLVFLTAIPRERMALSGRADAAVVLTGGMDRLGAGMALLTADKAGRLLISGVHPDTTRQDLLQRLDDPKNRFDCCVDLDRRALDTEGNATETARWVSENGFTSLIVVTSHYHMPRSMREFRDAMPDVELIPYPVFPDGVDVNRWWIHAGTGRLVIGEYTKFLASLLKLPV